MKSQKEYAFETALECLEPVVIELVDELGRLDPSAVYEARLIVAKIEGILLFMRSQI